jgi:hypothetical protein
VGAADRGGIIQTRRRDWAQGVRVMRRTRVQKLASGGNAGVEVDLLGDWL